MTKKIINGIEYDLYDFVKAYNTHGLYFEYIDAWAISPGFYINDSKDYVFDVDFKDYNSIDKQFYFLHIPKTSGMSIKHRLIRSFKDSPMQTNFIQNLNKDLLKKSAFISGHFALYPLLNTDKPMITYTILRDPLSRFISHYLYTTNFFGKKKGYETMTEYHKRYNEMFSNNKNLVWDDLEKYYLDDNNLNLQHKYLTSTIDYEESAKNFMLFKDGQLKFEDISPIIQNGKYFKVDKTMSAKERIDSFDLVDILEIDKDCSRLSNLISKEFNKDIPIEKDFTNSGSISSKEFISQIPKNLLNNIIMSNSLDYDLYEYAIENRKAG